MKKKYMDIFKNLETSQNINDRILICDSLNLFIRCFAANPTISESGNHVGGIVGFLKAMGYYIRTFNATRCIMVFDGRGGSARRKKLLPSYKANRTVKDRLHRTETFNTAEEESQSMKQQLSRLLEYLNKLPITCIAIDNIEADDTIAYLTKQYFEEKAQKITIVSTDRDFLQLVSPKISVFSPTKKIIYTPERLQEEFNFHPNNYLLYRVLTGDAGDNIMGIPGLGLKTLMKIADLSEEMTLSEFKIQIEEVAKTSKLKIVNEIINNWKTVELNHKLMQLDVTDISASAKLSIQSLSENKINALNTLHIRKLSLEDQIYSNFASIDEWANSTFSKLNAHATQQKNG